VLVGARFVCARCALRGASRLCPSCKKERLDLTTESGLAELRRTWPLSAAWERGLSFLSPRAILVHRRLLVLSVLMAAGIAIAAPVMAVLDRPEIMEPAGLGLLVGIAVSLVLAPFMAAFFAVFFFYYAHVLRLLLMLVMLLIAILPVGRLRLLIALVLVRLLAGTLLPRIELDDDAPMEGARGGQLAEAFALHHLTDGLGWMDRADAWIAPLEIEAPGGRLRLDLRSGSLVFTSSYYRDLALAKPPSESAYRTAAIAPESAPPPWISGHGRRAAPRHRMISAGRPVRWAGGELVDGVLTGTPESPLHVEIS
jgi:hypothetical protein